MSFELTHARLDPALCHVPGLFRTLRRGERATTDGVFISHQHGSTTIEFLGPGPLCGDDLRVLAGLVAMAAAAGAGRRIGIGPQPESALGQSLRERLRLSGDALNKSLVVATGTYGRLAREVGYRSDSGSTLTRVRASVDRLAGVTVRESRGSETSAYQLISHVAAGEVDGKRGFHVALNPRLTACIIGNAQYLRLNLAELRRLPSEPARLLLLRLLWLAPGNTRTIGTLTLCSYIWPTPSESDATQRQRRRTLRGAIAELETVGWTFGPLGRERYEVTRPISK